MYKRIAALSTTGFCLLAVAVSTPALSQINSGSSDDGQVNQEPEASNKAYLGLRLGPVPALLRAHLPDVLGSDLGLVVFAVDPGSPGATAGIEPSDIMIRFNGKEISSYEALIDNVDRCEAGQEVTLSVLRRGQPLDIQVKLGKLPADVVRDQPLGTFPGMPDFDASIDPDALPEMQKSLQQMNEMMEKMNREFSKNFGGSMPAMPKMPSMPSMPSLDMDAFSSSSQSSSSSDFTSMNVNKTDNGRFHVQVKYKAEDGEIRSLDVEGTPEEIRTAADSDEKMPTRVRKQLMRALDAGSLDLGQGNQALGNMKQMQELWKKFNNQESDLDTKMPQFNLNGFNQL